MEGDRNQDLEQRERKLRQREVELRLREMERDINRPNPPFHQTVKHQSEKFSQPWMKKAILGLQLFGIGVVVLVAVRIAAAVAGIVMFAALAWMAYKLFLESPKNKP
ncbi:DUF3040 domain-containing protein [Nostoc sp. 106C]|uniref:DUF3040 domain-containing protein n=1 Tax=Nostoc sp. 106C TaxID=1932667 RepID=UPI000A3B3E15|nr:DUF3040 domain-containing protein [Nostoc sp. 106C]OUL30308.1 hypothetical protein BV375_14055 [Nostoc sp. 106C]